ncbi:SusC/RagA family TonB-linked outer membrane protein [Sediminibacterium sp.]|uniref:SusC/RagA family TonB-linked outer membrane protein n=1 Tax=Sediminibacterium sp. TaxID=1917865 RepID=UPI0027375688|nr:SusC/RagA family TonB-linked outer membrane protein [Sediminibacterium sp.]MDP3393386.1 SusC/RagA family TonB-linked outer membrane protein [Sediminibacterium sp.]MDP3567988.1 SusC/RagA family TonB-linked outer membrane protein [Sediminibacterium sp.]
MRKLVTVFLCLLFSLFQLQAQNRTVTGTVTDESGKPVSGASVLVKGTTAGTLTKENGTYSLSVPSTATILVISGLNLAPKEVKIDKNNVVNVSLRSTVENLDEVVVTGYAREKKTQFAGAAAVLSGKVVETVPVGAFDQALQGRVPGMLVNSGSGQPGSSAQVTIRGVQSIAGAGAQPLYVIDGVPLPAFDMQTINPNDFESITVLKDANSAALYGARGGTGVIVITTKKGKAGPTNLTYRTQYGFTQAPDFTRMNLMETSDMFAYEERQRFNNTPGWTYSPRNPAIPAGMTAARKQFLYDSIGSINSNWADILYRTGVSKTHEFNLSGGNDKTRFFMSAGLFDQQGIDLGSQLTRYTVRFNLEHTADKLTVRFNNQIGYSISKFAEGDFQGNSPRNPFQMTYRAKTYENPYRADGSIIFGANTSLALTQVGNLLEGIANTKNRLNQIKVNSGLTVAYKILPSLTVQNTFGIDVSNDDNSRYVNPGSYIGSLQQFQSGLAQEGHRLTSQIINTSSLVFSKRIANIHEVEAGAYFEVVRGWSKGIGLTLFNLDPRLTETGQGAGALPVGAGQTTYPQNSSSAKSGFGIRSYFATARYTYDGKYSINANVRRDGTSRIVNQANREITTWSAGFVWNALKENFMANQRIFTDLKVRASYGIVPNIGSIATGGYGVPLNGVPNYQGPQVPTFGTAAYAGSTVVGLVPNNPGNPDLKIEKIQKLNIGIDFAVWQNRARFTVDVYNNRTVDLFVTQPLSGTTGFGSLSVNAGIMTNKGVEATVSVDVIKNKDFGFTVGANHSMNKNNIEDLGLVNEYFLGTFVIRKGLPYGSHYTVNYLGADPATGRPMYEGPTGTTVYSEAQAGRFAKFGTYLPKHQGGFNFDIRYKAITVSALFTYQFDVVRSNNTRNWITRGTPGYHTIVRASRELIDGQWQKPGDVKPFQSSIYDRGFTSSDLEDAKFLRFRNLTVAYQIPPIKTAGGTTIIKGARFYVQAQNLAIWSPWRGLDPEDNNNISLNEYPNPRTFVTGIDINF